MAHNGFHAVLNGEAGKLIGACLLQNVRRENVSNAVRPVGKQSFYRSTSRIGVVDAVSLNHPTPHTEKGTPSKFRIRVICFHDISHEKVSGSTASFNKRGR